MNLSIEWNKNDIGIWHADVHNYKLIVLEKAIISTSIEVLWQVMLGAGVVHQEEIKISHSLTFIRTGINPIEEAKKAAEKWMWEHYSKQFDSEIDDLCSE